MANKIDFYSLPPHVRNTPIYRLERLNGQGEFRLYRAELRPVRHKAWSRSDNAIWEFQFVRNLTTKQANEFVKEWNDTVATECMELIEPFEDKQNRKWIETKMTQISLAENLFSPSAYNYGCGLYATQKQCSIIHVCAEKLKAFNATILDKMDKCITTVAELTMAELKMEMERREREAAAKRAELQKQLDMAKTIEEDAKAIQANIAKELAALA